jgi:hypothetical protein
MVGWYHFYCKATKRQRSKAFRFSLQCDPTDRQLLCYFAVRFWLRLDAALWLDGVTFTAKRQSGKGAKFFGFLCNAIQRIASPFATLQ